MKLPKLTGWTMLWLCLSFSLRGQGWEKSYGDAYFQQFETIVPAADGGGGFTCLANEDNVFPWLVRLGENGDTLWTKFLLHFAVHRTVKMVALPGEGYVLGGFSLHQPDSSLVFLAKTDLFGDTLWLKKYPALSIHAAAWGMTRTADGGFALTGKVTDAGQSSIFLLRTDADGNMLWAKTYDSEFFSEGCGVAQASDGGYFLTGSKNDGTAQDGYDLYLLRLDPAGDTLWTRHFGAAQAIEKGHAVLPLPDGGCLTGGLSTANGDLQGYLLRLSATGDSLWTRRIGGGRFDNIFDLLALPGGDFLAAGETTSLCHDWDGWLFRFDELGNVAWQRGVGGSDDQGFRSVLALPGGSGFAAAGFWRHTGLHEDGFVVKLNPEGFSNLTYLSGEIVSDGNLNCVWDENTRLDGWLVKATGAGGTFYAACNPFYTINLPPGAWQFTVIPNAPGWSVCDSIFDLNFTEGMSYFSIGFLAQPAIECPALEIEMAAGQLVRCEQNEFFVTACNRGTQAATGVSARLLLDPAMSFVSTTGNLAGQNGDTLFFDLGDFEPGACDTFRLSAWLDENCTETVAGQAHRVEARIFPDSLCPAWQGAFFELSARCENDSARFTVRNAGDATVPGTLNLLVIEDQILFEPPPPQPPPPGDTIEIAVAAAGQLFRLEMPQAAGYPGYSMPAAWVEGCGATTPGEIHVGFATQYPEDEAALAVAVDAQESLDSVPPTLLRGFPKGYGGQRLVAQNQDLEYAIHFVNPFADNVPHLVIRDTLSPHLDPETVRPGAGSHPFIFDVVGEGVAEITLINLAMPGAQAPVAERSVFVNFRVGQRPDLPPGTEILNRAAFFSQNRLPVFSNQTVHRVDTNFIQILASLDEPAAAETGAAALRFFPNPFSEMAVLEGTSGSLEGCLLEVFSADGSPCKVLFPENGRFVLRREDVAAAGWKAFRLRRGQAVLASGRFVVVGD